MVKAKYLAYNEWILLNTLIEERNNPGRAALKAQLPLLRQAYDEYLNNFPVVETLPQSRFHLQAIEESALGSCYSYRPDPSTMLHVRGKIFSTQDPVLKAWCPYCLIAEPEEIDHYVGQAEFTEYSVLLKNLVPSCKGCNFKKNEGWRANFRRKFIHFYFDDFIQHRFLQCQFVFTPGELLPRAEYSLIQPAGITNAEFAIITSHFDELELLGRYSRRVVPLISNQHKKLTDSYRKKGVNIAVLINELQDEHDAKIIDFGVNYFEAILYETMAASLEFIDII